MPFAIVIDSFTVISNGYCCLCVGASLAAFKLIPETRGTWKACAAQTCTSEERKRHEPGSAPDNLRGKGTAILMRNTVQLEKESPLGTRSSVYAYIFIVHYSICFSLLYFRWYNNIWKEANEKTTTQCEQQPLGQLESRCQASKDQRSLCPAPLAFTKKATFFFNLVVAHVQPKYH